MDKTNPFDKINLFNKQNVSENKNNPFDRINPINNNYLKIKEIITKINDKNELIKINKMIDQRLKELQ